MQVALKNITGEIVGEVQLRDDVFGVEPNKVVMHQALVRQLANARQGTHHTKTRSEVRGTTAKWYRQKGTGRARHGARTAPIFVGGGVAHGPKPRSYKKDMPRKMRHLALRSALSAKAAVEQIVVLDELSLEKPRTKAIVEALQRLNIEGSAVFLLAEGNDIVQKSINNVANAKYLRASYLNVRDLLGHDYIIMPQDALAVVESILGTETPVTEATDESTE
jgi:large subunit ribosomal protein L4